MIPPSSAGTRVVGALHLTTAALATLGVFVGLPARWLPVDVPAGAVILLLAASGGGLLARTTWAVAAARLAASVTLALGVLLVALLSISASTLAGIYGPVGKGGMVIFLLVLALVFPYAVAFPLLTLRWARSLGAASPRAVEKAP